MFLHLLVMGYSGNAAEHKMPCPDAHTSFQHTRVASQLGEQSYLELHAAGTKLSPLPNQLIWPGYHGSGLQSKSQTNPEGLAAGEQKKLN